MTARALLEAVADRLSDAVRMYGEARTTMQSVASVAHDAALDIRRIASSLEGQAFLGFVSTHWRDDLSRDDSVSVTAIPDGSHSLPVFVAARTAKSKDKPA